ASEMQSQLSERSHGPSDGRQTAVLLASAGEKAPAPLHVTSTAYAQDAGRHTVPAGMNVSGGQVSVTPSQSSGSSHRPTAGRQTPAVLMSGGQAAAMPVHVSGGSQPPADGRQTVPAHTKPSAGQSLATPSQLSAVSHGPADRRQTAVLLASAGQKALAPVQVSATSHPPAAGRHTVPAGITVSDGQALDTPSHDSATSHPPAAA